MLLLCIWSRWPDQEKQSSDQILANENPFPPSLRGSTCYHSIVLVTPTCLLRTSPRRCQSGKVEKDTSSPTYSATKVEEGSNQRRHCSIVCRSFCSSQVKSYTIGHNFNAKVQTNTVILRGAHVTAVCSSHPTSSLSINTHGDSTDHVPSSLELPVPGFRMCHPSIGTSVGMDKIASLDLFLVPTL